MALPLCLFVVQGFHACSSCSVSRSGVEGKLIMECVSTGFKMRSLLPEYHRPQPHQQAPQTRAAITTAVTRAIPIAVIALDGC